MKPFFTILFHLLASLPALFSAGAENRPNVIFLLTDDQSSYSLGCYGNKDVRTPHIDGLSLSGMTFDHHYDTTAICMASRVNVMTGLYEYRHGCNFDHGPLTEKLWKTSYPIRLRQAGYLTAFAGKFGFEVRKGTQKGRKFLPEEDFDKWGGGPGQTNYATAKNPSMKAYAKKYPHSSRSYGAFGRDFVKESAKTGKPFCLSISFKAPHKPDQPDPLFDKVYAGRKFTKPANYGREYGKHFSLQSKQGRQYERFISWGYRDKYDEVMAVYHQMVHGVDAAVGMIRAAVEEAGVEKNTVFIFTSDNGFFCGSHGYGSKVLPYEESTNVPMIIYDPRHPSSGKKLRSAALTANIDVAPTILELAGLEIPAQMDGVSLLPLLDNPKGSVRETANLINVWGPKEAHSYGVVTKDYKYLYWPYESGKFEPTEELYHLTEDPHELTNLAPHKGKELLKMRVIYDKAVDHWKREGVNYNGYEPYGDIFDRNTPWRP
ncbi:MAG: acetylglucosamine-6-sulfatase [Opitutae bacterium]|nr:acetylglucosamine-6-sulfatase [Opitutae bacterium]HAE11501.1 acetylglucosamine-6-sulfatase [Opitutae bacterium]|tara:strand:+ start:1309 stop:2775 length:1467 start_codon:yes stop_codon:yes gene_type:complete